MPIQASEAVVVPPTDAKVFDEVWLKNCVISSPQPTGAMIEATMCYARTLPDGSKELLAGSDRAVMIPNIFEDMTKEEGMLMYSLVALVKNRLGM